ncbi:Hypothetical protein NTJ_13578 [Nesidiocoris tenuis]|uniref:Uncharacterized protein n=1 Tax=Nesidiocoris tenuis TaxID=355587 RepID=A0ABN7B8R1_9HEMI|nr:Hypothetical protein NTJ_13578 [Nesidiocoris tenuis]
MACLFVCLSGACAQKPLSKGHARITKAYLTRGNVCQCRRQATLPRIRLTRTPDALFVKGSWDPGEVDRFAGSSAQILISDQKGDSIITSDCLLFELKTSPCFIGRHRGQMTTFFAFPPC